jgi:hypothetical protein
MAFSVSSHSLKCERVSSGVLLHTSWIPQIVIKMATSLMRDGMIEIKFLGS